MGHMATVDSERGVMAYMSVLSKDVELIGNLGLRKVSQLWGMTRDFSTEMGDETQNAEHTWIFFLLMPKWVRMRPTDAYYTVHPRSQGSAFRMSTAGSSVLLSLGSSVCDPAESARRKDLQAGGSALLSARGSSAQVGRPGAAKTGAPGQIDLNLIETAVSSLPAIRDPRGV